MVISSDSIKKYFTYIIVLLPILGQYGFLVKSITIADILLILGLIFVLLFSFFKKKSVSIDFKFAIFSLWYIFISIIILFSNQELFSVSSITSLIKDFIYSIVILFISKDYIDMKKAVKFYSNIVIILSVIIFIQYILYNLTGSFQPWVVNSKYFPAVYVNDDYFLGGYEVLLGGTTYRMASLFSEPALFAQYVCPCLILNIFFSNDRKKNYLLLILVTTATLLTKSANGIIYIIITWLFTIIYNLYEFIKKRKNKIKPIYIYGFIFVLIFLPLFPSLINKLIQRNDQFLLWERIIEIFDKTGQSSGSMRVIRGWTIFNGLNWNEKIFGIGTGNIINYLNFHPTIVKMFDQAYNGYMSGLSAIFVNSGLIGGVFFLIWWFDAFFKNQKVVKGLLIFLMLYLIASNSLFTTNFVMVIIFIITLSDKKVYLRNYVRKGNQL